MGWLRKISRDFRHSPRISFSVSCTFFPGRDPWTGPTRETGVRDPASTSRTPRTLPASTPHALPLRDRHWAWERWAGGIQVPPQERVLACPKMGGHGSPSAPVHPSPTRAGGCGRAPQTAGACKPRSSPLPSACQPSTPVPKHTPHPPSPNAVLPTLSQIQQPPYQPPHSPEPPKPTTPPPQKKTSLLPPKPPSPISRPNPLHSPPSIQPKVPSSKQPPARPPIFSSPPPPPRFRHCPGLTGGKPPSRPAVWGTGGC